MLTIDGGSAHHPGLIKQWREGVLCDIQVNVGNRIFMAHRCVLAVGSDFMAACFRSGTADSAGELELKDLSADAFEPLLEYMYCGKCVVQDECSALCALLEAAVRLQLNELSSKIAQAVRHRLTPENAKDVMQVASCLSVGWLACVAQHGATMAERGENAGATLLIAACGKDDEAHTCLTRWSRFSKIEFLGEAEKSEGELSEDEWLAILDFGGACASELRKREPSAVIEVGRKWYLVGGASIGCFDPLSGTTRDIAAPFERFGSFGVAQLEGRIYIAGGRLSKMSDLASTSVVCFEPSTERWLQW